MVTPGQHLIEPTTAALSVSPERRTPSSGSMDQGSLGLAEAGTAEVITALEPKTAEAEIVYLAILADQA